MAGKGTISISFKMDADGKGFKALVQDANGLRIVMDSTLKQAEALKTSLVNWSAAVQGLQSVDRAVSQLSSQLNSLTSESAEFSKAMKAANTMAGKDSAGFKQLKGEVADLAKKIPIARDQLANGLYQTISNGVPESNWIEFLNTSARSAVGGLADINKVVGVTSTLIKNYGLEWGAAADIQDKIQLTAKNGVTSFDQLAEALPRVAGNASTLGVSIDELMGTFATLTGVSGNTAEVSTQLAAIFTSLVKPSSEAAQMAAEMGIQFDAAAIKAAGGFQNFLTRLNDSVKAYAQTNGVLEQEVYGRLFGSAEALRALIPLQGELSDKFAANVSNMVNSAGTMDAAYADMSSHGEAVNQMLRNQFATVIDVISGFTSAAQPYINFSAGLLSTISNATILNTTFKQLKTTFKQLNTQQLLTAARAKSGSLIMATLGLRGRSTAAAMRVLSSAMKGGAYSATALKIALRGLLAVTGIGLAIAAVVTVIECLVSAADDATESTNKFLSAEERAKKEAEELAQLREQETAVVNSARAALEINIARLKEFNGTKEQEKKIVNEMNNTYGETMGYFSSVADWYNALIANSKAYCQQMLIEARTRWFANRIADLSEENNKILYDDYGNPKLYSTINRTEGKGVAQAKDGTTYPALGTKGKEIPNSSKHAVAQSTYNENKAAIDRFQKLIANAVKEVKEIIFPIKGSSVRPASGTGGSKGSKGGGSNKATEQEKSRQQELNELINKAKDEYVTASEERREELRKDIATWSAELDGIELLKKQAERPLKLDSIRDIDNEIAYQQTLWDTASDAERGNIEKEIQGLKELRRQKERAAHVEIPVEEIKSYEQLNDELRFYNDLLQEATTEESRGKYQTRINSLNARKEEWDNALMEMQKPAEITALNTLGEIDAAISYYQQKQQKATDDEIQNIQATIDALERKREALLRGADIAAMQSEADEINALTGRDYKVRIEDIGFDALTAKINELHKLLNDTENPLTDKQRTEVQGLIAVYERWRKQCVMTYDTLSDGWGTLKDISSGVEGITSALEGNVGAWRAVINVVEGFLQIFEGLKKAVEIISLLRKVTQLSTAATEANTVATEVDTASTVANTVAAAANTAATGADAAASVTDTAAKSGEAIAKATASGAGLPFPANIVAIVTGVSAVLAALSGIGKFASGGIVGGNSPNGDRLLARVNSGEMILNKEQQAKLFKMINAGIRPFAGGGIVSGPTVGLIGEYAGAKNNPEVVAPLDQLRGMLKPVGEPVIIGGTLRAAGREIICVLANETRIASKSGKKTNIIL